MAAGPPWFVWGLWAFVISRMEPEDCVCAYVHMQVRVCTNVCVHDGCVRHVWGDLEQLLSLHLSGPFHSHFGCDWISFRGTASSGQN